VPSGAFVLSRPLAACTRLRTAAITPWVPVFLTTLLILCKSTGASVYAMFVIPVVALTRRPRMWLATVLAGMVILFPLLRGTDVFPTDTLVEWAHIISEDRALSLRFRFDQEDQLLERARGRLVFGWRPYSRDR